MVKIADFDKEPLSRNLDFTKLLCMGDGELWGLQNKGEKIVVSSIL